MLLEVENLEVGYGEATAVRGISLNVAAGEIVSVIGPNGAGKSTLVNAIGGVLRPTAGMIRFDTVDITRIASYEVCEAGIAIVPEGRRLFTDMSVIENLELGGFRRGARGRAAAGLERVFGYFPILRDRQAQIAGSMSGGQQQMLAIGRALMAFPKLLLMDEPSLGLAPSIVSDMFAIIKAINREGVAVLLVEQNIVQALAVASRAYVIEQGRIATSGDPAELSARPEIRAAYLGL